jgi:osmotically-inducible protein OsmY
MRTLLLLAALCAPPAILALTAGCSKSNASEPQSGISGSQLSASAAAAMQSDADIKLAAKIRTAILNDPRVAGLSYGVTIVVREERVTLQGKVSTAEQKSTVESVTRGVEGVREVENLIYAPGQ